MIIPLKTRFKETSLEIEENHCLIINNLAYSFASEIKLHIAKELYMRKTSWFSGKSMVLGSEGPIQTPSIGR